MKEKLCEMAIDELLVKSGLPWWGGGGEADSLLNRVMHCMF